MRTFLILSAIIIAINGGRVIAYAETIQSGQSVQVQIKATVDNSWSQWEADTVQSSIGNYLNEATPENPAYEEYAEVVCDADGCREYMNQQVNY